MRIHSRPNWVVGAVLTTAVVVMATAGAATSAADTTRMGVTFERIVNADGEPGNWMTYSRDYRGWRYSPLKQIDTNDVRELKVMWAYQLPDPDNETSPLVVDGVMYLTGANSATALDARTGRPLWTWSRPLPPDFRSVGFDHVNRGPAVLGEDLYVTTLDCYLVALDLKTGAVRWVTRVADYRLGYSMTVAPLAVNGKVLVGVSGGEAGIRGLVAAYDAKSGSLAWRFWTIPGPGQPGYNTWSGDSARTGGGPTWVTGTYDPNLKLVYWGVGNPSPDWDGDSRRGDNLFTDSLIALDAETGKLRWYFQFTPHDTHDWDACHVPVLFDAKIGSRERKLVAIANRNGFYYVLDRETGQFLFGKSYGKQTWARRLDVQGSPILEPNSEPTRRGNEVWPNANGSTIWYSPSYDPQTTLTYVPVRIAGAVYYKRNSRYQPGRFYPGGGEDDLPAARAFGEIRAMQATTGDLKWRFPLMSPASAGVLSTAGGLVFSGTDKGDFFALDARTGKALWHFQTGSFIEANPISFAVDGREYVAIASGRVLFAFGL